MTASYSALSASAVAQQSEISARAIVVATFRFVFANAKAVLAALFLPVALAAGVLLILFKTYFSMLALYLTSPDARMASLTLSATIAGYFVWLLLNVVASGRLARLIQGQPARNGFDVRGMAPEARLYAAVLRFLLVLVLAGALVSWLVVFASQFLSDTQTVYAVWLGGIAMTAFGVVFFVRCGLLIPALAMYESRWILRRGWQLSRGHFWQICGVWAALMVLPGLLLQTLGDFTTRSLMGGVTAAGMSPLAAAAHAFATDGISIAIVVLTLTLSSALCLTLTTIGSCLTYKSLQDRS